MYSVTIDPSRHLMTVTVSGFWKEETFKSYIAEAARATAELQRRGGFGLLLVDMSDYPLQGQAVAEMHGKLMLAAQQRYGVKAAVVMRSALSRLQAARVAKLTGNDLFDDADSAIEALLRQTR